MKRFFNPKEQQREISTDQQNRRILLEFWLLEQ